MNISVKKKKSVFRAEYSTRVNIKAGTKRIWHLLKDVEKYPNWSSSFTSFTRDMTVGAELQIITPEAPGKVIKTKLLELIPYKWMLMGKGSALTFKVRRSYKLTERKDGTSDFEMRESFSGLLIPTFGKKLPDLTQMFEEFIDDLKKVVE